MATRGQVGCKRARSMRAEPAVRSWAERSHRVEGEFESGALGRDWARQCWEAPIGAAHQGAAERGGARAAAEAGRAGGEALDADGKAASSSDTLERCQCGRHARAMPPGAADLAGPKGTGTGEASSGEQKRRRWATTLGQEPEEATPYSGRQLKGTLGRR